MGAVALTLFFPKYFHKVLALLLDALFQAPLPEAKVSERGQGESPLLLPQVPVGGDQSWQEHPTMSQSKADPSTGGKKLQGSPLSQLSWTSAGPVL